MAESFEYRTAQNSCMQLHSSIPFSIYPDLDIHILYFLIPWCIFCRFCHFSKDIVTGPELALNIVKGPKLFGQCPNNRSFSQHGAPLTKTAQYFDVREAFAILQCFSSITLDIINAKDTKLNLIEFYVSYMTRINELNNINRSATSWR